MKQKTKRWEEESVSMLVLGLSVPTVVAMVTISLGQLADALFAARLGTTQAAAVGLVLPYLLLLQALGYTVALGGSTWAARLLGENREEQASQIATLSLWLAVAIGGVAAGVTMLAASPLVAWVGADTSLAPYAQLYLKTAAIHLPFYGGATTLCMLLRAYGAPFCALVGVVLGCAVQFMVAPWLIFGFDLGLAGAGFGIAIGQGAAFGILLWFGKKKIPLFSPWGWADGKICLIIVKNGISSLARQSAAAVAGIGVNRVAVAYGPEAVAALAAAGKVAGVLYSAFLGLGQGYLPLAGYYYGGKHGKRMRRAFWFAFWVGSIGITVLTAACCYFAPHLISWLSPDRMVQSKGIIWLRIQLIAMPLIPFGVLFNMSVQAAGRSLLAAWIACLRQGICLWLFVRILPPFVGETGLAWSYVAADAATLLICVVCCQIIKRPIEKQSTA